MYRKIALTSTSILTQFGVGQLIHKQIAKAKPHIYVMLTTESHTKEEVIKHYAKMLGLTIAVALVASVAAGIVVNAVDNIAFPNESGPY